MIIKHCTDGLDSLGLDIGATVIDDYRPIIHLFPRGTVIKVLSEEDKMAVSGVAVVGTPKDFPTYVAVCGRCKRTVIGGNLGMVALLERDAQKVTYLALKDGKYEWVTNSIDRAIRDGVLITRAVKWYGEKGFAPTPIFWRFTSDEYSDIRDKKEREIVKSLRPDSALSGYYACDFAHKEVEFRGAICRSVLTSSNVPVYNTGALLTQAWKYNEETYDLIPIPAYCEEPYTLAIFKDCKVELSEFKRTQNAPEPYVFKAEGQNETVVLYNPKHYEDDAKQLCVKVDGQTVYLPTSKGLYFMYREYA